MARFHTPAGWECFGKARQSYDEFRVYSAHKALKFVNPLRIAPLFNLKNVLMSTPFFCAFKVIIKYPYPRDFYVTISLHFYLFLT